MVNLPLEIWNAGCRKLNMWSTKQVATWPGKIIYMHCIIKVSLLPWHWTNSWQNSWNWWQRDTFCKVNRNWGKIWCSISLFAIFWASMCRRIFSDPVTIFSGHVMRNEQPQFQNSNGRFTTLVILNNIFALLCWTFLFFPQGSSCNYPKILIGIQYGCSLVFIDFLQQAACLFTILPKALLNKFCFILLKIIVGCIVWITALVIRSECWWFEAKPLVIIFTNLSPFDLGVAHMGLSPSCCVFVWAGRTSLSYDCKCKMLDWFCFYKTVF